MTKATKITFRKRGKVHHRGLIRENQYGQYLVAVCSCPGSQNGRLIKGAQIVCQGWDRSNCQN
jgi:hypothetical protein